MSKDNQASSTIAPKWKQRKDPHKGIDKYSQSIHTVEYLLFSLRKKGRSATGHNVGGPRGRHVKGAGRSQKDTYCKIPLVRGGTSRSWSLRDRRREGECRGPGAAALLLTGDAVSMWGRQKSSGGDGGNRSPCECAQGPPTVHLKWLKW